MGDDNPYDRHNIFIQLSLNPIEGFLMFQLQKTGRIEVCVGQIRTIAPNHLGRSYGKQTKGDRCNNAGEKSEFISGRAFLLSTIAIETSQKLFLGMINSVFQAPISLFDSTPSSRIINRSSTEQSILDTDLPYRVAGLVFALIQLLSIIVLMSHVAWQVFLLFLAILVISIWYQAYYISTARELARMARGMIIRGAYKDQFSPR